MFCVVLCQKTSADLETLRCDAREQLPAWVRTGEKAKRLASAMNKVLHANVVDSSINCESNFHPKLKVNWPTEMDAGDCATRWLIFSESSLCEIISTSESARKQWSRLKWQHYPPFPTELSQKPKNNEKSLRKFLLFGKWDFAFRAHAALEKLSRPPKAVRVDEGESAQTGLITTPKANASVETSPFPCSAFLALLVLPATNARSANKANLHKSLKFLKKGRNSFGIDLTVLFVYSRLFGKYFIKKVHNKLDVINQSSVQVWSHPINL